MSSPATVSEYGKFIDLQSYDAAAPAKSGSIYLSGAAGSELLRTNVGLSAAGNVTAVGSFIIGSADMSEADLEKLDGITNGTAAANKALVLDASKDLAGIRNLDLDGDMTAATVTMTGFTVDADGDTALKSLAVDDGSTIGCDSDTDLMSLADGALTVNGTLSADTSFTLDAVTVDATELGYLDGVTAGTAAASKALVLDASKNIGSLNQLTASAIKVDVLDVNTINSVTTTASDLEVSDRRIVAALSASSADADGGGLRIGGGASSNGHAAVLYDHANTALDFNIGGTTEIRLQDGVLRPETDDDVDLGASGAEFKDLYLDGVAYIDDLRADQLGAALDANSQAITNINVDSGVIDNTVIGGNTAAAGTFTTLVAGGNVDLGDATSDTITATGRFDSDLVPSTDSARALGTSALQWSAVHVDVGHIDQLGSALDGNSQNVTGVGTFSAAGATVTSLSVSDGNITNVGSLACDSITVDDATVGLDVRFAGNTGLNKLTLTDNLASALDINEGGNSYLKFVTTNGQEEITAGKELVLNQGGLVADDQAMVFGDDDDGSIAFISAANVVRFDGGSAGLHFNDTSVFGADGSGKDVSFHGAAANELMKYTAADHTLKFTDSSGAAHVTIGGDATSEFAVDVADGSNNKNKVRAAAFVTYSDERLKTDVSAIQNGLETVNNLKAVNFTWKKDGSRDFGFMAQELKQVVPQAVHGSEEGLYGVDYGRLSAILVSAIQEQSAQIASLKKQLENK